MSNLCSALQLVFQEPGSTSTWDALIFKFSEVMGRISAPNGGKSMEIPAEPCLFLIFPTKKNIKTLTMSNDCRSSVFNMFRIVHMTNMHI